MCLIDLKPTKPHWKWKKEKNGPREEAIVDGVTIGDNIVVPCESRNGK
jgi:hypothetical protein